MTEREKDFEVNPKERQGGCFLTCGVFQREEAGRRGSSDVWCGCMF